MVRNVVFLHRNFFLIQIFQFHNERIAGRDENSQGIDQVFLRKVEVLTAFRIVLHPPHRIDPSVLQSPHGFFPGQGNKLHVQVGFGHNRPDQVNIKSTIYFQSIPFIQKFIRRKVFIAGNSDQFLQLWFGITGMLPEQQSEKKHG